MDREQEQKAGRAYGIGISIFGLAFSIFWCCVVIAMGAWPMVLFGLGFVGLSAYRLVMGIKLSKKDSRQKDPWEQPRDRTSGSSFVPPVREPSASRDSDLFCPYCGREREADFAFCPKCSRRL